MAITATMVGVDSVRPGANGASTVEALVVVSGPEVGGSIFESMSFDVDFTQTTNQIQTAIASGVRAAILAQFGLPIPANGVNVMSFAKG